MPSPLEQVRAIAKKYPEAERAFLFGDHEVFRVRKKVFVWLGDGEGGGTHVSVKLKTTQNAALLLPFVTPSAYGMAKYGWVNADFPKGNLPEGLLREWIDESYRHTAPKTLLKVLDGAAASGKPKRTPTEPGRAATKRR